MKKILAITDLVLAWLFIPGLLFFAFYPGDQWGDLYSVFGKNAFIFMGLLFSGQIVLLSVLFRNLELVAISFFMVWFSFMVTIGFASVIGIIETIGYYWIVIYCIKVLIGLYLLVFEHSHKKIPLAGQFLWLLFIPLSLLITGSLIALFCESPFFDFIGFVFGALSITWIYCVIFQSRIYKQFFSYRLARGMHALTFLQVFQALCTYFVLVMGSILVGLLGLIVYTLVFLDIEKRKTVFHYMLFYYSCFFLLISPIRTIFINDHGEDFTNPSVIICNHQSLIDTIMMFRLYPKTIILTNDWVYNSPVFGHISKMADFFNVSSGIESIMNKLEKRVTEGYSILVFPEGTRSITGDIQRFHRGAFYIAEKLKLDIVPTVVCGTDKFLKKHEFFGKGGTVKHKVLPRITITDNRFGENYSQRAKFVRRYLQEELNKLREA